MDDNSEEKYVIQWFLKKDGDKPKKKIHTSFNRYNKKRALQLCQYANRHFTNAFHLPVSDKRQRS